MGRPHGRPGRTDFEGALPSRSARRLPAERGPYLQPRHVRPRPSAPFAGHCQRHRPGRVPTPRWLSSPARPVIGNFEFGSGVDYIRIPGVTKLPDGDYRSLNLNVQPRRGGGPAPGAILQTAEVFEPDVFIVDKEPTGLPRRGAAGSRLSAGRRLPPRARHPRRDGRAGAPRPANGNARARRKRSSATTTRSGSTASRTSTSRCKALDLPGERGKADHLYRLSAPGRAADAVPAPTIRRSPSSPSSS